MSQPAWRCGLVLAVFGSAGVACSFELAEVDTGATPGDDGGTFDAPPVGDDAGADSATGDDGAVVDGATGGDTATTDGPLADAPNDAVQKDTAPPIDTGADAGPTRVTSGLVVLYTFKEGAGAVVHDVSGVGAALDTMIETPANTVWSASGLQIVTNTNIISGVATKITNALTTSNALTVETWATSSTTAISATSARLVSCGGSAIQNTSFDTAQGATTWGGTMKVAASGTVQFDSAIPVSLARTHYVLTRSAAGAWQTYINGAATGSGTIAGAFAGAWDNGGTLSLANSTNGSRPFLGTMHLAAIYDRPLTKVEVTQNYSVGP